MKKLLSLLVVVGLLMVVNVVCADDMSGMARMSKQEMKAMPIATPMAKHKVKKTKKKIATTTTPVAKK